MKKAAAGLLAFCMLFLSFFACHAQQQTLRVQFCGFSQEQQNIVQVALAEKYPEFVIEYDYLMGEQHVKEDLLTKDPYLDIFCLSTQYGGVQELLKKGYYVDLAPIDTIAERVSSLYPEFRELFMPEEHIIGAYPLSMNVGPICMWNDQTAVALSLGAQDIPSSLQDMIDLVRTHDQLEEDYAILYFDNNPLVNCAFTLYRAKMLRDGEPLRYNTQQFSKLFSSLDAFFKEVSAEDGGPRHTLLQFADKAFPARLLLENNQQFPVAISATREDEPVVEVAFVCLIINPYTRYPEQAMELMRLLVAQQDMRELMPMAPEHQITVKNPHYESLREEYAAKITQLEQLLANAEPDQVAYYASLLSSTRTLYENVKEYWVTEETIAHYRQNIVPYFRIKGDSIYEKLEVDTLLYTNYMLYADGAIDEKDFLERLDHMMYMVATENE